MADVMALNIRPHDTDTLGPEECSSMVEEVVREISSMNTKTKGTDAEMSTSRTPSIYQVSAHERVCIII